MTSGDHSDARLLNTGQEYAEVCFVPNWNNPDYRYLAIREPLRNPPLPGIVGVVCTHSADVGRGMVQGHRRQPTETLGLDLVVQTEVRQG